jgi:hypothetical protein
MFKIQFDPKLSNPNPISDPRFDNEFRSDPKNPLIK